MLQQQKAPQNIYFVLFLPFGISCFENVLGETVLEDLGLETALHDLGGGQTKDIIQLALRVGEETETLQQQNICIKR